MMGLPEVLDDLRLFHHTTPPEEPEEFRLAGRIVKALTYVAFLATVASPAGIVYGALTDNALLLMTSLAAIPSFILLAMSYPAFVHGERWSLFAILLVGLGIATLAPLRFFTEAAALGTYVPATPPTPTEIGVFLGAFMLIYVLLLPETREGMRQARGDARPAADALVQAATPAPVRLVTPVATPSAPSTPAAPAAPAEDDRKPYACPSCGRLYKLRTMPPPGTPCPKCRAG